MLKNLSILKSSSTTTMVEQKLVIKMVNKGM